MEQENKKLVYVATPYRAKNIIQKIKHIRYAKKVTLEVLLKGYVPVTPHLYLARVLNDKYPDERALGLETGQQLLLHCDCIVVGIQYGISKGMDEEINLAQKNNIPIRLLEREVRKCDEKKQKIEADIADMKVNQQERVKRKANRKMAKVYMKKAFKYML